MAEKFLAQVADAAETLLDYWDRLKLKIQPDGNRAAFKRKVKLALFSAHVMISLYFYGAGYSYHSTTISSNASVSFGLLVAVIWPLIVGVVILYYILYYPLTALHALAVWLAS